jgi:spore coat polysaccharide biosynthesis protein SpsF
MPFGDMNVIEHIIKRAQYYNIDPILCTSTDESDNILEEIAIKKNIKYFRGSLQNKLKRWYDCANFFNLDYFHTVDADDPFFDGNLMHLSVNTLIENEFDIVTPTISSSAGAATVGYSLTTNIIKKAIFNIPVNTDTEMMWYYIDKVDNLKKYTLEEIKGINEINIRLTLDYQEDYWLLASLQRILGNLVDRKDINNFFKANPDFTQINWFRNQEWKSAQESKKI